MASIGPALPPGFIKRKKASESADGDGLIQDPTSESGAAPSESDDTRSRARNDSITVGPVIPVELLRSRKASPQPREIIGPSLPASLATTVGPSLPPVVSHHEKEGSDSDDEFVGPSPTLQAGETDYSAAAEFARKLERKRAQQTAAAEPQQIQRESWMTALPESLLAKTAAPALTAAPRSFKRRADDYEADFAGWTADPNAKDKQSKSKEEEDLEVLQYQQTLEREKQLEKQIAEHNKKQRGEALTNIVKKNQKPETSTERKPFDREKDLNIQKAGKFDADEMRKKADALKERFSSSAKAGQKFL